MEENKIKFIEEVKIKKELEKKDSDPGLSASSNPIKGGLMKYVRFKGKFNLKDLP